jgi:hypothetical protein
LEHQDPNLRDLNLWYRQNYVKMGIHNRVFYETKPTKGVHVVDALSADGGFADCTPIPVEADHISICKPADRSAPVYVSIRSFLQDLLTAEGSATVARQVSDLRKALLEATNAFDLRRLLLQANQLTSEHPADSDAHVLRDEVSAALLREATPGLKDGSESLVQLLVRTAPVNPETTRALAEALSSRLYGRLLGTIDIDPYTPSAILATRITGRVDLSWKTRHPELNPWPATALAPLGEGGEVPPDTVTLEDGVIRVRSGQLPADDRWRLFCAADDTNLAAALIKEPLLLLRMPSDPFDRTDDGKTVNPFVMVDKGYLLEAWLTALDERWQSHELLGLLVLLFARMQGLVDEALEPSNPELASWPPHVITELKDGRRNDLPVRQQSCQERLAKG